MTKNNITTSIDSSGNGIDVDDELQEINLNENTELTSLSPVQVKSQLLN